MMSLDLSLFFLEPEKLSPFVFSFAGVSLGPVLLHLQSRRFGHQQQSCIKYSLVSGDFALTCFSLVLLLLLCDTDGDPLAIVILDLLHGSLRVLRHRVRDITEAPAFFCV